MKSAVSNRSSTVFILFITCLLLKVIFLSSNLSVTTKHESQMAGTKIEYDHNGRILSKTPCARQIGTTVTLTNLFSTLPVRHKEFQRNIKKEFVKLVHVLNGYCLISSSVRINCTNLIGKGKKMTIVSTTGGEQIRDNITCVFGAKQVCN